MDLDSSLIANLAQVQRPSPDVFLGHVRAVNAILCEERKRGKCGEAVIDQELIHIDPTGKLVVVGDIHGDLGSLLHVIRETRLAARLQRKDTRIIFLGDLADRGENTIEVIQVILGLKQVFPSSVFILRGNHEGPLDLGFSPHDLPNDLRTYFGAQANHVYQELQGLFDNLYLAAVLEGRYLFVHGGVPSSMTSSEDIAKARLNHPKKPPLEEILWNDPDEIIKNTVPSPRGAGRLFGENVTRRVLNILGVKVIIRGHTPISNGVAASQNGAILTLFSRKGAPYFNPEASYLELDCAAHAYDAVRLMSNARKF